MILNLFLEEILVHPVWKLSHTGWDILTVNIDHVQLLLLQEEGGCLPCVLAHRNGCSTGVSMPEPVGHNCFKLRFIKAQSCPLLMMVCDNARVDWLWWRDDGRAVCRLLPLTEGFRKHEDSAGSGQGLPMLPLSLMPTPPPTSESEWGWGGFIGVHQGLFSFCFFRD